jgi:hypothetical protein
VPDNFGIHVGLGDHHVRAHYRLSDVKVKAAKAKEKDYTLSDGDGLQMRVEQRIQALEF